MDAIAYTTEKQGDVLVIKRSDDTRIEVSSWVDVVTYLLETCQSSCYSVVHNVDKFSSDLFSILPKKNVSEINNTGRTVLENGEKIFYSSGRKLSIGYGWINDRQRREVDIYGLSRYIDKPIGNTEDLIKLWYEVMMGYAYLGIVPKGLSSPIGAYEPLIDVIDFSRACDLDDIGQELTDVFTSSIDNLAWEEWRETYTLGHFRKGEVFDYDQTSAYSFFISKLPDLKNAKIIKSKDYPLNYDWALLHGNLNIQKDYTYFNMGKYDRWITSGQLKQIKKYQWGDFKLDRGYFIRYPKVRLFPFTDLMQKLYEAKCNEQGMVKRISKMVMNGLGGKFNSQYNGKPTKNYMPIYAKMVSSGCEQKVANLLWKQPEVLNDIISVQVDGVLSQKELKLPEIYGIGSWRKNPDCDFLVISQNNQFDGNNEKHPELPYTKLMSLIKQNPNTSIYDGIDLMLESHTREFSELPHTGKDLLERKYYSKPLVK